jgi:cyclohexadienyl dehydratase
MNLFGKEDAVMKKMLSVAVLFVVLLLCLSPSAFCAQKSLLDVILERGQILVGTTGDFKPFSYLNPQTGQFEGHDIDAALKLGEDLGVTVRFVETTWPTLVQGIREGRYDIAMCGITRTLGRQKEVGLTAPYIAVGKSPLIRKTDQERFKTLADIDRPGVKIGVNPGGTNERFVQANIKQAEIVVVPKNLAIPDKLAAGEVDVMITDNVEAMLVAAKRAELFAVAPQETYTRDDFGYMFPRDEFALQNWLNLWVYQMHAKGEFQRLKAKWIAE